jgi:orotate phosphoribosyltransferase-like protein
MADNSGFGEEEASLIDSIIDCQARGMNKTQIASELGFHRNTIHIYMNILNLPKHHMF